MDPGRAEIPDEHGLRTSPHDMPGTLDSPAIIPTAPGDIVPTLPEPATPPSTGEGTSFQVNNVILDGNDHYPLSELQPLLTKIEGRKVTLAEVNALADQITHRYRQAGFLLARTYIPAQRLENGELHLQVIEGQINQVNIHGHTNRAMERYAENIRQDVPIKGATLERNLLLMNDLPGNEVHGTLMPSQGDKPGTDLDVENQFRRWSGFIGADNRDSRYFGPWQGYGGLSLNDPFGLGDRISLRYGRSLEGDEMAFYEGQYEVPINSQGTTLSLLGQHNDGRADTFSFLNAKSDGDTWVARINHPWIRSREENLNTSLAFTWFNGTSEYLEDPDIPPSSDDRIRALRLGVSWDFSDRYGGRNLFKAELSQGLDIMGASSENRINPSRFEGQTDFTKLQFDAQRIQDLAWITDGLELYLALTGQTAFGDALLSPEQFGIGGSQFGRGYDPSEITGDNGLAGKVELQYNRLHKLGEYLLPTQYYGYWDVGKVWNNQPRDIASESLASAGFGARVEVARNLYVTPEMAFPLTRPVSAEEFDGRNGKSPRLYLSLLKLF